jgi:hypothetical protein
MQNQMAVRQASSNPYDAGSAKSVTPIKPVTIHLVAGLENQPAPALKFMAPMLHWLACRVQLSCYYWLTVFFLEALSAMNFGFARLVIDGD